MDDYHDAMDGIKDEADARREEQESASEGSPSESRSPTKVVDAVATGSLPVLDSEGLAKLWEAEAHALKSNSTRPGYGATAISRFYAKADQLEQCAKELRLLTAYTNKRQPEENNMVSRDGA